MEMILLREGLLTTSLMVPTMWWSLVASGNLGGKQLALQTHRTRVRISRGGSQLQRKSRKRSKFHDQHDVEMNIMKMVMWVLLEFGICGTFNQL